MAIVCLVLGGVINLGWINPGDIAGLYVLLPVGAVFFGLFLIELLMGRASAVHELDQSPAEGPNPAPAGRLPSEPAPSKKVAESNSARA